MGQKEPQTRFKKLRELPDGFDMITTRLRKRYRKGKVTRKTEDTHTEENLIDTGQEDSRVQKSDYLLTLNQQINETETKLKHRKHKVILIATWNVRTLYQAGKLRQALHEMENYGVEIMGISEARWKGVGEISVDRYKIIYSGQDETTGEHMNGVAIILNNKVRDSLISWEPVNDRIITARINMKNNNFTVVQCYAPTNVADIEDKEVFYSTLNRTMGSIPKEDIVLLMGDFNAKVGTDNNGLEDIMGKNGIGEKNENGEMMVELCGLHQLKIGGTLFKHKNCHKITWVSPDKKVQNQIDHICISEAWCNNLLDTRNKRGADIETDHYLVVAKIRAELQVMKKKYKPRVTKIFDIQKLNKEKFKERFIDMLREKEASIDYDNKGIQDVWQHCKDAFLETSKQVLGYKSSKKREWMSQDTWNKIKERRELKKRGLSAKTRENYDQIQKEYSKVAADIKKKIKRDKRAHMESIAQEAQKAAERGDTRTLFNNVRRISGTKRSQKLIKDKNGKVLTTTEEQLQRWTEYFKETLNMARTNRDALTTAKQPELQINTEPPTIEELKEAIQSCKNGKAPGIDQIRSEMLKVDTDTTAKMLLPLFRRVWIEEVFPDEWKTGVVVKLPKKGDLKLCSSWRGITLLSIVSKTFNKIILNRIVKLLDKELRKEQSGFRSGKACRDMIVSLRIIVEQSMEYQSPLYLLFVDYERAFDSIDRKCMWAALTNKGLPQKFVNLIKEGYNGYKCRILHEGTLSEEFETSTGVRQGCILSPLLFLVVIDEVLKTTVQDKKRGLMWTFEENLEDLDFADDICLLSQNGKQLQEKIDHLSRTSEKAGLKINKIKTKIMRLNTKAATSIEVGSEIIEEVEDFTYLGSIISGEEGVLKDVTSRVSKARSVFVRLSKIWRSSSTTTETKLKIFSSMVKPVLLYGCESWTVTEGIRHKLQVFINRCLRTVLKIWWPRTITNEELWMKTGQVEIAHEIRKRKLGWMGHTLRKDDKEICKRALYWNPIGRRKIGRPKETWKRSTLRETNKSVAEMGYIARDRNEWRKFVSSLCPSRE
jgi:hypothetical protein